MRVLLLQLLLLSSRAGGSPLLALGMPLAHSSSACSCLQLATKARHGGRGRQALTVAGSASQLGLNRTSPPTYALRGRTNAAGGGTDGTSEKCARAARTTAAAAAAPAAATAAVAAAAAAATAARLAGDSMRIHPHGTKSRTVAAQPRQACTWRANRRTCSSSSVILCCKWLSCAESSN